MNLRFAELYIQRELLPYEPMLTTLSPHFAPDREAAHYAQREMSIAASEGPPFAPYLGPSPPPKIRESTWLPADTDHRLAWAKCVGYSMRDKRSLIPHELPIQAFAQTKFVE